MFFLSHVIASDNLCDKQVLKYSYWLILANHSRITLFVEQGSKIRVIAFSLADLPWYYKIIHMSYIGRFLYKL